jgi:hypothetical protein
VIVVSPGRAQNNVSESNAALLTKDVSDFVRLMAAVDRRANAIRNLAVAIKGLRRLRQSCSLTKTQRGLDKVSA